MTDSKEAIVDEDLEDGELAESDEDGGSAELGCEFVYSN